MISFLAALSFLTSVPTFGHREFSQPEISNSRAYYPLVGLLIGLLLVGVEGAASQVFPAPLTAALLLLVLVAVTRGLHLDGLMDVCDGLFGGYTPERRLEIMRDSHVGAFALVGGISILILKYGALVSLLTLGVPGKEWALLLVPAFARWAMVIQLGAFSYVRGQGLGSPFHQSGAKVATLTATAAVTIAAVLLGGFGGAGLLIGLSLLAGLLGWAMSRMLGGLTGDTYGASNEVIEAVGLAAAVALLPRGWLGPWWWLPG